MIGTHKKWSKYRWKPYYISYLYITYIPSSTLITVRVLSSSQQFCWIPCTVVALPVILAISIGYIITLFSSFYNFFNSFLKKKWASVRISTWFTFFFAWLVSFEDTDFKEEGGNWWSCWILFLLNLSATHFFWAIFKKNTLLK